MRGLAAKELAVAEGANEAALSHSDLAAHGDEAGAAFEFVEAWHVTAEGTYRFYWDRTKWVTS